MKQMKSNEPPTAMEDLEGKPLTNDQDILEEAIKHYKSVFKHKDIIPGLEHIEEQQVKLCHERLKKASKNTSLPWTEEDVKNVLKSLKTGKAKDPYNMPNELFKPEVAGTDLILAITKLMNRIKDELHFPTPMNICNITNLYKKKQRPKETFQLIQGDF